MPFGKAAEALLKIYVETEDLGVLIGCTYKQAAAYMLSAHGSSEPKQPSPSDDIMEFIKVTKEPTHWSSERLKVAVGDFGLTLEQVALYREERVSPVAIAKEILAKAKAQADAALRKVEKAKAQADAEAKAQADAEAKAQADAEAKAQADAEAKAKAK
jgi:hypothetical protein